MVLKNDLVSPIYLKHMRTMPRKGQRFKELNQTQKLHTKDGSFKVNEKGGVTLLQVYMMIIALRFLLVRMEVKVFMLVLSFLYQESDSLLLLMVYYCFSILPFVPVSGYMPQFPLSSLLINESSN